MSLGTDFLTRYFSRQERKITAQKVEHAEIEQEIPAEVTPVSVSWEIYQDAVAETGQVDRALMGHTTNPQQYLQDAIAMGEPSQNLTFVSESTGDVVSGDELRKQAHVIKVTDKYYVSNLSSQAQELHNQLATTFQEYLNTLTPIQIRRAYSYLWGDLPEEHDVANETPIDMAHIRDLTVAKFVDITSGLTPGDEVLQGVKGAVTTMEPVPNIKPLENEVPTDDVFDGPYNTEIEASKRLACRAYFAGHTANRHVDKTRKKLAQLSAKVIATDITAPNDLNDKALETISGFIVAYGTEHGTVLSRNDQNKSVRLTLSPRVYPAGRVVVLAWLGDKGEIANYELVAYTAVDTIGTLEEVKGGRNKLGGGATIKSLLSKVEALAKRVYKAEVKRVDAPKILETKVEDESCITQDEHAEDSLKLNAQLDETCPTSKPCVCRECGWNIDTKPGVPCSSTVCPKCGAMMQRVHNAIKLSRFVKTARRFFKDEELSEHFDNVTISADRSDAVGMDPDTGEEVRFIYDAKFDGFMRVGTKVEAQKTASRYPHKLVAFINFKNTKDADRFNNHMDETGFDIDAAIHTALTPYECRRISSDKGPYGRDFCYKFASQQRMLTAKETVRDTLASYINNWGMAVSFR